MAAGGNESDWLTTIRRLEWQQKGQVIWVHLSAKNRTHIIKTHPAQKAKQTFLPFNYPGKAAAGIDLLVHLKTELWSRLVHGL